MKVYTPVTVLTDTDAFGNETPTQILWSNNRHNKINDLPLNKRYVKTTYLRVSKGDSSRIILSGDWDENEPCVTDVEECGYNCAVPIRALRSEESELHDAVEDEDFVYKKEYYAVKRILSEMQNCLKRTMRGSVFDALYRSESLYRLISTIKK